MLQILILDYDQKKFLLSIPAKFKYSLISKATVWSVNLFSDNLDPLENLSKYRSRSYFR